MYYERQRGSMCRLHSLNAYFGFKKLDDSDFLDLCEEYDTIIKGLESKRMDGFAEGRCIINYIIDKIDNKYTLTIPIKSYKNSREFINLDYYKNIIDKNINHFFEFNTNHVWLNKKKNNKWWKIDSISGINEINPRIGKNGLILVFDSNKNLIDELDHYRNLIKKNKEEKEIYWCNMYHCIKCLYRNTVFKNTFNTKIFKSIYFFLKYFIINYRKYSYHHKNTKKNIKLLHFLLKL